MLQYLGLVLVVASWIGGYFLVSKWYDKDLPTISRHAASNKRASWLFALVLVGLGGFFYYWIVAWLVPLLDLSGLFIILLTVSIICQMITGLISDSDGWKRKVHRLTAFSMAVLYVPLSALIIASLNLSLLTQIICSALLLYMVVAFCFVAMAGKAKKKYLLFQASYIIAFQLIVLLAAYL